MQVRETFPVEIGPVEKNQPIFDCRPVMREMFARAPRTHREAA